ncbi:DNA-directed RNA polymerase [Leptolyngbya phage Lbo-JY16]
MFYSASERGFFPSARPGAPTDLVEISQEYYAQLLASQTTDLEIAPDENGYPVIAPRQLTYQQELAQLNSNWQSKVESYNRSFALAALSDGLSEEAKKAAIRAAYEVDKAQNTADRAALKVKHGIGGV